MVRDPGPGVGVQVLRGRGRVAPQQAWEALNLLIALRTWKLVWHTHRVRLEARAGNVAAFNLVAALRGRGFALNTIARELALDLGDGTFRPDFCVHSPGVASKLADDLSRRFMQGVSWSPPAELRGVHETHPPALNKEFVSTTDMAAEQTGNNRGQAV